MIKDESKMSSDEKKESASEANQTMRDRFREHHNLTESEKQAIWNEAIFVLDTNVLLHIYRYKDETRQDLFKALKEIEDRIWIPFQVASEFYKKRISVIVDQKKKFAELKKAIEDTTQKLRNIQIRKEWFIKSEELIEPLLQSAEKAKNRLNEEESRRPDLLRDDSYLEELVGIVKNRMGTGYAKERVDEIQDIEGKQRQKLQIPPGYKDEGHGDLIIWFEILDYAEYLKKPIIFVTDDRKEDWWQEVQGEKLGPRLELRREIREKAQVDFLMLTSEMFLKRSSEIYSLEIKDSSLLNAKEVANQVNMAAPHSTDIAPRNPSEIFDKNIQAVSTWLSFTYYPATVTEDDSLSAELVVDRFSLRLGVAVKHAFMLIGRDLLKKLQESDFYASVEASSKNRFTHYLTVIVSINMDEANIIDNALQHVFEAGILRSQFCHIIITPSGDVNETHWFNRDDSFLRIEMVTEKTGSEGRIMKQGFLDGAHKYVTEGSRVMHIDRGLGRVVRTTHSVVVFKDDHGNSLSMTYPEAVQDLRLIEE